MSFTEMFEKQRAFMLHASTCTSQYDEPHRRLYGEILGLLDEAKQAERERDEARALLMRQQDITIDAYKNLDAAHACLGRILGTVRGSNLGYEIEALLEKRREGHHRGGWICSECGHAEQREREVLCWNCGKGEMQFNASLVFPLAPSEARRG